jgi:hypothetical protein
MLNVRMAFESKCGPVQSGVTRNVSRSGMLVQYKCPAGAAEPDIGDRISVEMDLPAPSSKSPRFMSFNGTVSRVSRLDNGFILVALDVSRLRFRDSKEHEAINGDQAFAFESFLI